MPIKSDPVEKTRAYHKIKKELEDKIATELYDEPRYRGFCYKYWRVKEEILLRDYGIVWKPPHRMNPHIRFE